ncbi:hypothetical protein D3C73_1231300 [compost metagenome]
MRIFLGELVPIYEVSYDRSTSRSIRFGGTLSNMFRQFTKETFVLTLLKDRLQKLVLVSHLKSTLEQANYQFFRRTILL